MSSTRNRGKILQVNEALAKLDDGKNIFYIDFLGSQLIETTGPISKSIMPISAFPKDAVTGFGCERPKLKEILGGKKLFEAGVHASGSRNSPQSPRRSRRKPFSELRPRRAIRAASAKINYPTGRVSSTRFAIASNTRMPASRATSKRIARSASFLTISILATKTTCRTSPTFDNRRAISNSSRKFFSNFAVVNDFSLLAKSPGSQRSRRAKLIVLWP